MSHLLYKVTPIVVSLRKYNLSGAHACLCLQGFGDVAVNIFCREAQEAWEELFPFADDRSLKLAAEHGLPDDAAKLAELVDNDRHKFVRLLAALIRSNLRKVPVDDEKATVDSGELVMLMSCSLG